MAKTNKRAKNARKRHAKSCEGKQGYPNRKAAEHAVEALKAKRNWRRIEAYDCQQCGSWHLGNRSW